MLGNNLYILFWENSKHSICQNSDDALGNVCRKKLDEYHVYSMPLCLRPSATTALLDNFLNATAEQCQDIGQTSWSLSRRLTSRKHAVHTLPWPSTGLIALDLFLGTCSGAQDNFFIKRSAAQNQITPPRCDGVLRLWATGTLVHNPINKKNTMRRQACVARTVLHRRHLPL